MTSRRRMPNAGAWPRRGQVWRSSEVYPEATDFLVISCDDWNQRPVNSVLGVEVAEGADDEVTRYAPVIDVAGVRRAVFVDTILPVPLAGLAQTGVRLAADAMAEVDQLLDEMLAVGTGSRPRVGRPTRYPFRGNVRFADLQIPGEGTKPVVVVSSEAFAGELDYRLVVACRATSNPANPHDYDVVLSGGRAGKAVCSDLQTVSMNRVTDRTPQRGMVDRGELEAIMTKVRRLVGITSDL